MGEVMMDKTKKVLNPNSKDPIFLLMMRTGLGEQNGLTNVSPFLIQKCIDTVGSRVKMCKKLRNGTILIECFNGKQADSIIKIKSLSTSIFVNVEEHNSMNKSKGTIYTHDIKCLTDAEILSELKSQNPSIIEIKRIKKRNPETKALTNEDMGLYIVTFNTSELPEKMILGYQTVDVRAYIPYPMRCFKCFSFGHINEKCPAPEKKCPHCGETDHTEIDPTSEKRIPCAKKAKCVNCQEGHNSFSKNCEVFKKEFTIQKIRITQKKSIYEARKEYHRLNPLPTTYAKAIKPSCSCECRCSQPNANASVAKAPIPPTSPSKLTQKAGPSSTLVKAATLKVTKADGSKINILSTKLNKRKKRELAKEEKKHKNLESEPDLQMDTFSGMTSEIDSSDE